MKTKVLTQDEIIRREFQIYRDSFVDIDEHSISFFQRKNKVFEEYDFNMPQTIFFIKDEFGNIIVGRKTLSQYYLDNQLKSLNCSRISYNMILGVLEDTIYDNRKISLMYKPFNNDEKIRCFRLIKDQLDKFEIEYPFRFRFYDTNLEQTSSDVDWNVDDAMARYLSIGESHIRDYTLTNLVSNSVEPSIIYDPACSTGEFLKTLKGIYPESKTIGHDMSPSMVEYSRRFVDESCCCDAINSPVENGSVDLLVLRFLNGGVVDTECAYKLFDNLVEKVCDEGHILCIGHTPILIGREQFEDKDFEMLDKVGYDKKSDSVFQYYLAKRKQNE